MKQTIISEIMIGQKYNRLEVISEPFRKGKYVVAKFQCECGAEKDIDVRHVYKGNTKSCGCLLIEKRGKSRRTHGMSNTDVFKVWQGIKKRCQNKNYSEYNLYGGRGIKICQRWESFEYFISDMGNRPTSKHSIDRIDVNGDYEPNNCRWTTSDVQARNRRNTYIWTVDNIDYETLEDAANANDVSTATIYKRCKGYTKPDGRTYLPKERCGYRYKYSDIEIYDL